MNTLTIGVALVILGTALCLAAWSFFRKEGNKFLMVVPFSYAHRYMRQPGGTMWWVGIALLLVGIFNCWSAP